MTDRQIVNALEDALAIVATQRYNVWFRCDNEAFAQLRSIEDYLVKQIDNAIEVR